MNSELRDKLRKLTMFYNRADFMSQRPNKEKTKDEKRTEELEFLFFDKDSPLSLAAIFDRLKGNSSTRDEIDAEIESIEADIEGATGMANWIPDFLEQGKFDRWDAEIKALKSLDEYTCTINFAESSDANEDLINHILGPCFSKVGTNDILLPGPEVTTSKDRILFAQIDSDYVSPLKKDADLLDSYLNYIPNIERSRCVPFLNVEFLTIQPVSAIEMITDGDDNITGWRGNDEQLAVFNFLNGQNRIAKQGSADFLMLRGSQHNLPTTVDEDDNPVFRSVTSHGMETFTLPQTVQGKRVNPLTDPFRPLMSLDSATIHVYAAGEGDISFRRATLKFTLFDRTRLRDVSFLLNPERFGSTIVQVEAGWNHPDESTAYGAILGAMKINDLYKITKVDFSMKDASTFNISIDIAMLGSQAIFHENIFGESSRAKQIKKWQKEYYDIAGAYAGIANSLGEGFELSPGNILPKSIVTKKGGKDAVATFSMALSELKKLQKDLQEIVAERNFDDDSDNDIAQDTVKKIDEFLSDLNIESFEEAGDMIETLKNELISKLDDPGDSQDPYLVPPYDGVVEIETSPGTPAIDRQIGLVPGAPGTDSIGALILPGDSAWKYQWNTVEGVTGTPPPAESRPGDPPNPEEESSRPTDPQSMYPHYWWARRNVAVDGKVDAAGNDVWENLWTARFPTLNNALAYQILNEAFPIVPGVPPTYEDSPAETPYISFGKLLINLVAAPVIARSNGTIIETHVITYNFNKFAAGLGYKPGDPKTNIATFAFKKEDVKAAMTKHIDKHYDIMPKDIIRFAKNAMKNKFNEQFGIVPVDEDGQYSDPVAALKQDAQIAADKITSLKKRRDSIQSADPSNTETYVSPEEMPAELDLIEEDLTTAEAELEAAQTEMAELVKEGEEAMKASLGVKKLIMPDIKLFIETAKHGKKTIVRFHVYDANEKPYELQEHAANLQELLDSNINEKDPKSKNTYEALNSIPGVLTTVESRRPDSNPRTILNQRSLAVKNVIKANMPSITYGTEATAINSMSVNTISDNNMNTAFMLEATDPENKDPSDAAGPPDSPPPAEAEAQVIIPVTLSLDMLGCPVLEYAQQIFVDLGTMTDLDNVYGAVDIQHNLKPGSFTTTVKMSPTYNGTSITFGDIIGDIIADHDRVAHEAGVPEADS